VSAAAAALVCLLVAGCAGRAPESRPLHLQTVAVGEATRAAVVPDPEYKISARLKPVLELRGGGILRFDSPHLTPDSAYFAEPPSALLPGRHDRIRGTLRASVCKKAEAVCRSVRMEI
jgi:hypothetical protein